MTLDELDDWAASFEAFHASFCGSVCPQRVARASEKVRARAASQCGPQNGWQLAEVVGDATPDRTQRLLYQVNWNAEVARDRLQQFVIEPFSAEEGIEVVDETGFLNKGD